MTGYDNLIKSICEIVPHISGGNMIEIGTTREIIPGHDSTPRLYEFCKQKNIKFITVDMDKENTKNIVKRVPGINAVTSKGEDYLKSYTGEIDYIYLDAFDFYHDKHSVYRQNKYRDILGTTINDTECHKMHYDCCVNMLDKLSQNCVITFDDILDNNFSGKGKTAIPFLLDNGFKVHNIAHQSCTLIRA